MTIFFDMVRKIFGKGCNQMKQSEKQHRFPIFCDRLCELQGKKTIAAFAAFLGLSRPTVNFYLNGDRVPDALTLRQIAERCNVSSDWLLGLSDVKDPDGTLQQVCRYTGLNAQSVQFLHNNIAWRDEDGRYRGGFSDDEYNPKQFFDEFFRFNPRRAWKSSLMSVVSNLCHAINEYLRLPGDCAADCPDDRSIYIEEINREYRKYGIIATYVERELQDRINGAKTELQGFFDLTIASKIIESLLPGQNERSDPDAPQE